MTFVLLISVTYRTEYKYTLSDQHRFLLSYYVHTYIVEHIVFSAPFLASAQTRLPPQKSASLRLSRVAYKCILGPRRSPPHDDNNNNTAFDGSEISCTGHLLKTVEKGSRVRGSLGKEISGEPMTNRNAMIFNHIMFAERTANRWL